MSYVLYLDETGHDHRKLPLEVRGGIALDISTIGDFNQAMREIEFRLFGCTLASYGSELKAKKQLEKKRFSWASKGAALAERDLAPLTRHYLTTTARGEVPAQMCWNAFGRSSINLVRKIPSVVKEHGGFLFASMIPRGTGHRPEGVDHDFVRKDIAFLLERFFYFLEDHDTTGILVLDESDRTDDRRTLLRIQRYLGSHVEGRRFSRRILSTPLFAESHGHYPIQVSDVLIYSLATAFRRPWLTSEVVMREDVRDLLDSGIEDLIYKTTKYTTDHSSYVSRSVFLVPQPWHKKEEASQTKVVFRAPKKTSLQH